MVTSIPSPSVPQFDLSSAPFDQQAEISLLNEALRDMYSYTTDFVVDLDLFHYGKSQEAAAPPDQSGRFSKWRFVAARDAVMSIFHFRKEMLAANDLANPRQHIAVRESKDKPPLLRGRTLSI